MTDGSDYLLSTWFSYNLSTLELLVTKVWVVVYVYSMHLDKYATSFPQWKTCRAFPFMCLGIFKQRHVPVRIVIFGNAMFVGMSVWGNIPFH